MADSSDNTARARGEGRPFVKGDPRINRAGINGRKTAKAIRDLLKDEGLAEEWVKQIRIGVETGDPKCLELYGRYALGPASGKDSDESDDSTSPDGGPSNSALAKVLELVKEDRQCPE